MTGWTVLDYQALSNSSWSARGSRDGPELDLVMDFVDFLRTSQPGPQQRKERTKELLDLVGLADRRVHRPDELSGGEQQRIAIATALANDPPLILADEPTGELDTKTGQEILDLFGLLNQDLGKTLIIVTHDARVADIASRILEIEDGKIIGERKTG